jgi:CHAT domain-containing protein/tetratricopeptide (TPR) repeat protein
LPSARPSHNAVPARLERARRLQAQATVSGQVSLFRDSAREARQALDELEAESHTQRSAASEQIALRRDLLNVRALSLLRSFDIEGHLLDLSEGLSLLRKAAAAADDHPDAEQRAAITRDLAIALVRAGEQHDDIALLQEAERLLMEIAIDIAPSTAATGDYDLVNAAAVASMRLGMLTGDRAKVEGACRDLGRFLKREDVAGAARSQTTRNLVAALTANARQNRSERVYRQVLNTLDKAIDESPSLDPYYLQYRGTIRLELAGLTGDLQLARGAIADLSQLVSDLREGTAAAVTATHSLAQAYFQLGKRLRSVDDLGSAVHTAEQALALAGNAEEDARVTRILVDVGAYRYALGIVAQDKGMIAAARTAYEDALARSRRAAAPALFAQIARGLFVLLFQQKEWSAALAVFSDIESAWSQVVTDPSISSEVYDQLTADLAGQYDRAAWCEIELDRLSRATERIERGRAQRLAQSRVLDTTDHLPATSRAELQQTADALMFARRRHGAEETRRAWENYLSTRRRAGLDMQLAIPTAEQMRSVAGRGGAIVQIFAAEGRGAALITRPPGEQGACADEAPTLVHLTVEASAVLKHLLDGNPAAGRESWQATYHRYAGNDSDASAVAWSGHIRACLNLVGQHVIRPIDTALRSLNVSPGSEVIVSLPGAVSALPVLSAAIEGETRFCDRWSASITPSIAALSSQPSARGPHTMLAISDPLEARASLAPLPLASSEAVHICRQFPIDRRRHLTGGNTTVDMVLDQLPTASLVHVACHGVYDWDRPSQSGLELARARRLSVAQIAASPGSMRATRLIFLSACETAIAGQTSTPDEFLGVLPAFLHCGVQAAIGTLWPVFDDAAMLVACRFYHEFLDGAGHERCPPATALARAQAWLRDAKIDDINGEFPDLVAHFAELASGIRGVALRRTTAARGGSQARHRAPVGEERPFADPINWAGFVVLGR